MNERIQLVQAGVDPKATPGNNPRARRAEIWAIQSGVLEEDDGTREKRIIELAKQRLLEEAEDSRNPKAAVVKSQLAKAMLDVYSEGGDLHFVGIGLRAIHSDLDREKAGNSSIERFYRGEISLQAAFSEIDPIDAIQSVIQSVIQSEMIGEQAMLYLGAAGGKWAELQNEIARRTAWNDPPSIYYRAFDIEHYLEQTETRRQ